MRNGLNGLGFDLPDIDSPRDPRAGALVRPARDRRRRGGAAPRRARLAAPSLRARPAHRELPAPLRRLRARRRGRGRARLRRGRGGQPARRCARPAPLAGVHGDRRLPLAPRDRDAHDPLLAGARRVPGRDPGRTARERDLRGGIRVRRRPAWDRGPADSTPWLAPGRGAGGDGRVVRLDGREPAAVRRAEHRGGDEPPGHGAGDRRDDRLRGQRRPLLDHLPEPPEPAADHGHSLLPPPVRGDDRRGRDR